MKQQFFFCFGLSRDLLCSSDGCRAVSDTEACRSSVSGPALSTDVLSTWEDATDSDKVTDLIQGLVAQMKRWGLTVTERPGRRRLCTGRVNIQTDY